jgi:hypothetical protein
MNATAGGTNAAARQAAGSPRPETAAQPASVNVPEKLGRVLRLIERTLYPDGPWMVLEPAKSLRLIRAQIVSLPANGRLPEGFALRANAEVGQHSAVYEYRARSSATLSELRWMMGAETMTMVRLRLRHLNSGVTILDYYFDLLARIEGEFRSFDPAFVRRVGIEAKAQKQAEIRVEFTDSPQERLQVALILARSVVRGSNAFQTDQPAGIRIGNLRLMER